MKVPTFSYPKRSFLLYDISFLLIKIKVGATFVDKRLTKKEKDYSIT